MYVSLSHEVNPEIGEFERVSTTVVNAFLQPVMIAYVEGLASECLGRGLTDDLKRKD